MERKRVKPKAPSSGGMYFKRQTKSLSFIPSGCRILDRVLGGGWPEGRIANVVGDASSGKTLLMIEACANFAQIYPDPNEAEIHYDEVEAAFDKPYARALGMPVKRVTFHHSDTVEDFFSTLSGVCQTGKRALYILDSLDAISDKAEQKRDMDKGSYGAEKPKKLGQLFRRLVRKLKKSNVTLIIVSQVRDKIGVMFGDKHTRTGGRALEFYCSQVLWLSQMWKIKQTRGGVERKIGVRIKAQCKKNKVALPYRDCEFEILFGFGVDDVPASAEWLEQVGHGAAIGLPAAKPKRSSSSGDGEDTGSSFGRKKKRSPALTKYLANVSAMTTGEYAAERQRLAPIVDEAWAEVESRFLPQRSKYGSAA